MRLLVQYLDGSVRPAILTAAFGTRLRVSIPAMDDAVEFKWASGQWQAENGDEVEIQFDAATDEFYRVSPTAWNEAIRHLTAPTFGIWSTSFAEPASAARVD